MPSEASLALPRAWIVRPVFWFVVGLMINALVHESAHALMARACGFSSTLHSFWATPSTANASQGVLALIDISGPLASLALGVTCWLFYRPFQDSAAGVPLVYGWAFGLSMFFGNLMSAPFVGDFSHAVNVLQLPPALRWMSFVFGIAGVAVVLANAGRTLQRWAPASVGRAAGALVLVVVPAVAGTALIIAINSPLPDRFIAPRIMEGALWLFGVAGALTGRSRPAASSSGLQLRWFDWVAAISTVVLARLLVQGVALTS